MTGCLAHFFLLVWGVIFISNRKMTPGTEKDETISNILTIYPIQSNHCVEGLLIFSPQ